jgi:hypothetical protein
MILEQACGFDSDWNKKVISVFLRIKGTTRDPYGQNCYN